MIGRVGTGEEGLIGRRFRWGWREKLRLQVISGEDRRMQMVESKGRRGVKCRPVSNVVPQIWTPVPQSLKFLNS